MKGSSLCTLSFPKSLCQPWGEHSNQWGHWQMGGTVGLGGHPWGSLLLWGFLDDVFFHHCPHFGAAPGRHRSPGEPLGQEGSPSTWGTWEHPRAVSGTNWHLPRLHPLIPVVEQNLQPALKPFPSFTTRRLPRSDPSHPGCAAPGFGGAGGHRALTLPALFPADDVHAADGRQVCRRHELYVSFQDLGWLVRTRSPREEPRPPPGPRGDGQRWEQRSRVPGPYGKRAGTA